MAFPPNVGGYTPQAYNFTIEGESELRNYWSDQSFSKDMDFTGGDFMTEPLTM
jgi:hypothetical protein